MATLEHLIRHHAIHAFQDVELVEALLQMIALLACMDIFGSAHQRHVFKHAQMELMAKNHQGNVNRAALLALIALGLMQIITVLLVFLGNICMITLAIRVVLMVYLAIKEFVFLAVQQLHMLILQP